MSTNNNTQCADVIHAFSIDMILKANTSITNIIFKNRRMDTNHCVAIGSFLYFLKFFYADFFRSECFSSGVPSYCGEKRFSRRVQ